MEKEVRGLEWFGEPICGSEANCSSEYCNITVRYDNVCSFWHVSLANCFASSWQCDTAKKVVLVVVQRKRTLWYRERVKSLAHRSETYCIRMEYLYPKSSKSVWGQYCGFHKSVADVARGLERRYVKDIYKVLFNECFERLRHTEGHVEFVGHVAIVWWQWKWRFKNVKNGWISQTDCAHRLARMANKNGKSVSEGTWKRVKCVWRVIRQDLVQ